MPEALTGVRGARILCILFCVVAPGEGERVLSHSGQQKQAQHNYNYIV